MDANVSVRRFSRPPRPKDNFLLTLRTPVGSLLTCLGLPEWRVGVVVVQLRRRSPDSSQLHKKLALIRSHRQCTIRRWVFLSGGNDIESLEWLMA